ncbi:MAG: ribosome silencing factor [Clostridiales bacterium]|nr:ribosome silencing factor [Clostridiales bacterium]
MDTKELKKIIVKILESKKAIDIDVIDIDKVSILADTFVVCSATSVPHVKSLVDELEEKLEEIGQRPLRKEGYDTARWVLLDFGNVVVHIFHRDERDYYDLDSLWKYGLISHKEEKGE